MYLPPVLWFNNAEGVVRSHMGSCNIYTLKPTVYNENILNIKHLYRGDPPQCILNVNLASPYRIETVHS